MKFPPGLAKLFLPGPVCVLLKNISMPSVWTLKSNQFLDFPSSVLHQIKDLPAPAHQSHSGNIRRNSHNLAGIILHNPEEKDEHEEEEAVS